MTKKGVELANKLHTHIKETVNNHDKSYTSIKDNKRIFGLLQKIAPWVKTTGDIIVTGADEFEWSSFKAEMQAVRQLAWALALGGAVCVLQ
jgi:hypothetical protein